MSSIDIYFVVSKSISIDKIILFLFLVVGSSDVYNQVISVVTHLQLTKTYDQRKNFDLRRLLAGSERLIDHLLTNDSNRRIIQSKSEKSVLHLLYHCSFIMISYYKLRSHFSIEQSVHISDTFNSNFADQFGNTGINNKCHSK